MIDPLLRRWLITNIDDIADNLLTIPEVAEIIRADIEKFLKFVERKERFRKVVKEIGRGV